jgi:hypothetical protein
MGTLFSRTPNNTNDSKNHTEESPTTYQGSPLTKKTIAGRSPSLKGEKNSPKIYPAMNHPTQTNENSHILTQFILNYSLYDTEETPNNSKIIYK